MADSNDDIVAYHYNPSLVAAVLFTALFAVSSALHTYQMIRTRATYMLPLLVGAFIEIGGFAARVASSIEAPNFSLTPYIIQSILILIAPMFLAATVYMVLGYIILAVDGEKHSMIREKFLTKIFVLGDIMSFLVQSTGAGLVTKQEADSQAAGKWIIVGGLIVQIFFFGFFMVVGVAFYHRNTRNPTPRSTSGQVPWRLHMWLLFTASGLIMIRSVFRVIEYVQGVDGYLLSHEIFLYVFDAALMCAVVLLLNLVHPTQITGLLTGRGAIRMVLKKEDKKKFVSEDDHEGRLRELS